MKRILIVDDSSTMRKVIIRALRQAGFEIEEIIEADNGQDGLSKLEGNPPVDIVFTDINMPVMNGLDFIGKVRARPEWSRVPVLVITTEGGDATVKDAILRGANDLVRKPFTPEHLKEKLSGCGVA